MTGHKSRVRLTAGRVSEFSCLPGMSQTFLWDTIATALVLRATPSGRKTYVFESRLNGSTLRMTIGTAADWPIEKAREEAQRLKMLVDCGTDPRELARQQQAAKFAAEAAATANALTVGEVWPLYLKKGKPKRRDSWKPRYRADLEAMASPGGEKKKRGNGLKRAGPLYPLMKFPLVGLDEDALKAWYDSEAVTGLHQAARALMMFRGFLRWCTTRPEYRRLIDRDAGKAAAILESLPRTTRRTDALEAGQVSSWWAAVEQLNNRTASAYLRALLLTGARREEMASLTWSNVDFTWRKLTLADKVETTRIIPLSPYMAQMLATLPRVGPYVFASAGKLGRIADTRNSHKKALHSAAIEGLTIHGLRRSFSLLGEAGGAPAGAIAQVMGHKPSAIAEGYRPRSIDALRPYLGQIERHILALADVQFDAQSVPGKLRAVN